MPGTARASWEALYEF